MPYHPGGTDPISRIRWALQDGVTDPAASELKDEELQAAYDATDATLPAQERVLVASLECARMLLRRYARQFDFSDGQQRLQMSQRVGQWRSVVAEIERDLAALRDAADGVPDPGWGVAYVGRLGDV
jgi:hypothetical protein